MADCRSTGRRSAGGSAPDRDDVESSTVVPTTGLARSLAGGGRDAGG